MTRPASTLPNYRMNGRHYVLHRDETPVGPPLMEVALALDAEDGILHKHGNPEAVNAWARDAQSRLRAQGDIGVEMADQIKVITGRFPVDDLNRCITHSGYVGVLYRRMMLGQLEAQGSDAAEGCDEAQRTGRWGPTCS